MSDLYNRQQELDLSIPNHVVVIGVGGIGSWVALNFALVGTKKLSLIDFDIVEEHNLNRTPFKVFHIGQSKTYAIQDLIIERRLETEVNSYNESVEEAIPKIPWDDVDVVVDCRDKLDPLPINIKPFIKAGYDGTSCSVYINPHYDSVWDDEPQVGYRTVPSYLVPPQLIASIIVDMVVNKYDILYSDDLVITFDVKDILDAMRTYQVL